MFERYRNRVLNRGNSVGDLLRQQSNTVIEHAWNRDPHAKQVYVVKVDSGLPEVTPEHNLIDVKFNVDTYHKIVSDDPAYLLQFRHGAEKYHPEIDIGSYVYMADEDNNWKWWLICLLDERPEFRQYHILECNWELGWVANNTIYRCLTVQRVQQSYNSGSWDADRTTAVDNITSIWLPTNDDTLTIGYNQRFLISDPKRRPCLAWSVSKIEDTQPIGLTKLKLTQETFDTVHDNAELMLANYYNNEIEPTPSTSDKESLPAVTITYNGTKPNIKVGGSCKVLTPVFSDVSLAVDKWVVTVDNIDISNDSNYIMVQDGSALKLSIAENYNLIGKILVVQLVATDGSVTKLSLEVV